MGRACYAGARRESTADAQGISTAARRGPSAATGVMLGGGGPSGREQEQPEGQSWHCTLCGESEGKMTDAHGRQ
jgi:hypothetical protein